MFVIMSTRENIRLIARSSLKKSFTACHELSYFICKHVGWTQVRVTDNLSLKLIKKCIQGPNATFKHKIEEHQTEKLLTGT